MKIGTIFLQTAKESDERQIVTRYMYLCKTYHKDKQNRLLYNMTGRCYQTVKDDWMQDKKIIIKEDTTDIMVRFKKSIKEVVAIPLHEYVHMIKSSKDKQAFCEQHKIETIYKK